MCKARESHASQVIARVTELCQQPVVILLLAWFLTK
jgi:hypothetical protein